MRNSACTYVADKDDKKWLKIYQGIRMSLFMLTGPNILPSLFSVPQISEVQSIIPQIIVENK